MYKYKVYVCIIINHSYFVKRFGIANNLFQLTFSFLLFVMVRLSVVHAFCEILENIVNILVAFKEWASN